MSVQKPRPRFGYRPEEHVPSTLVEQLQLAWHWYEPERLVSSFRMCCIGGPCERHRDERPWIPTQEDIDAWDAKAQQWREAIMAAGVPLHETKIDVSLYGLENYAGTE